MGNSQGSIFRAQSMFKQNNGGANLSTKLAVSVSILILGDILLPTAILRNTSSWSTRQWPSLGQAEKNCKNQLDFICQLWNKPSSGWEAEWTWAVAAFVSGPYWWFFWGMVTWFGANQPLGTCTKMHLFRKFERWRHVMTQEWLFLGARNLQSTYSKIPRQWSHRIHARAWTTVTLQFFFLGACFSICFAMFLHSEVTLKYSEFLWWSWSVGFTFPLESGCCWCFPCRLRQLRKDIEVEYLRTLNARGPSWLLTWRQLQPATWRHAHCIAGIPWYTLW